MLQQQCVACCCIEQQSDHAVKRYVKGELWMGLGNVLFSPPFPDVSQASAAFVIANSISSSTPEQLW